VRSCRLLSAAVALLAACAPAAAPRAAPSPLPPPAPAPAPLPADAEPSLPNPRVREIVAAASPARVERDIRTLVSFGTRHTLSDTLSATRGIGAARRWLFDEYQRISQACGGCLEVRYVDEIVKNEPGNRLDRPTRIVDVVAIQRGRTDPDRYLIMEGHYDTRVTDVMNVISDAPGANDDGSGVAATLEAARLLSRYPTDATVVYAALAGEEQNLFGGRILARFAREQGWRVEGVINNDIVGNTHGGNGVHDNTHIRILAPGIPPTATAADLGRYLSYGGELDTPSRELARYVDRVADLYFPNLDAQIIYRLDRYGRGGDHTPFFLQGDPAIRMSEPNEDYTRQHQDLRVENGIRYGDLPDGVDFPYLAKVAALNAASLASLAFAPPPPDSVVALGALAYSTTLRWKPVATPDLAGYRVYWRLPTDPNWTHSRFVGNVTETVLQDVVIDNYFFGVAAVDRDGNESYAVFPRAGR
jgi:hypothetical protein